MKKNILIVILTLTFFVIIKIDFKQPIAVFSIILPLSILILSQLYIFFFKKDR